MGRVRCRVNTNFSTLRDSVAFTRLIAWAAVTASILTNFTSVLCTTNRKSLQIRTIRAYSRHFRKFFQFFAEFLIASLLMLSNFSQNETQEKRSRLHIRRYATSFHNFLDQGVS